MKKTLALVAAAGLAGLSQGQANINLGNLAVNDAGISVDLMGAGIAPGNYTSYSVSVDWVAGGGNPFSTEAIWAFTDAAFAPGIDDPALFTFYADPGPSADAIGSGDPVTLTWNGFLSPSYQGGDSLWFNALQTFGGSDASWNNVDITLGFDTISAPPINADLGTNPNSMTTAPIGAGEVQWFEFDLTGGAGSQPWELSLAGSTNTGGSFGDNDTEIGLYDASGNLIATNDDEDFGAGILTSVLNDSTVGALADGTYFVAVGNFNTVFGPAFDVTSDSTAVGETKLTASFIPAPASAALLGLGGLAAARRRRA
ncbi:MAG: hypothetical protein AAFS11_00870 [Planctomycetota bacterium]